MLNPSDERPFASTPLTSDSEPTPTEVTSAGVSRAHGGTAAALGLILIVAAILRFSGVNWDDGHNQHPDERFIVMVTQALGLPRGVGEYFDTARSPLNPYNRGFDGFAYGTLPVFVVKALSIALKITEFEDVTALGRMTSAAFDLGTVLLVFCIGATVFGRGVGLLAAAFSALTVLQIQLAHFYTVDSFLAFFTAFTLLFAYRAWQHGRWSDALLMGVGLGLAEATKVSGVLLIPVVLLACLLPSPLAGRVSRNPNLGLLAASLVIAFLTFRIAEPYAFLGPSPLNIRPNMQFVEDISRWVKISSGEIEVPFMVQWARTPAYLDPLRHLVQWGMGPPMGLAALGGLLLAAAELFRWRSHQRNLLLVVWGAICLIYFGGQFAKFLRYLIPVYPALAVLAAYGLIRVWRAAERLPLRSLRLCHAIGMIPIVVALLYSGWYAAAFTTLYVRPHSRVLASDWIYRNVPQGATLATEHWDDRLPFPLGERKPERFRYVSLNLYEEEDTEKVEELARTLDEADYVVLASYRLAGSIPRLPERYPMATAYYRMLFAGELGFEQRAVITQSPEFLGFRIDDSRAPEDLTVYEHPTVTIFQKSAAYSSERTLALLESAPIRDAVRVAPLRAGSGTLTLDDAQRDLVAGAGTWSELFPRDSLPNQAPLLVWLVALELIGLIAFPAVWRLLPQVPDRGWTVAKMLAIVGVAYVGWMLQSLGLARFGAPSLLAALLGVGLVSWVVVWQRRGRFLGWVRENRGTLLAGEAVFLASFAVMLGIRLLNPDLWHANYGGEKPMDFAYFNAVLKSPVFPPYDPWFAGGYINYYYYGFVLAAVPTRLLGIVPSVAFNLAIPTFFALLCAATFGLVSALVLPRTRLVSRRGRAFGIGISLTAVLFVGILGDLDGLLQLVESLSEISPATLGSALPLVGPLLKILAALPAWVGGADLPRFDFWRPTRVIGPEEPGPITEFPFFTFLYGDLHAHLLALPVTVTVLIVALNTARTRPSIGTLKLDRSLPGSLLPLLPSLVTLALLVGTLRATNTWDFPIYLVVGAVGLALAVRPRDWRRWQPAAFAAAGLGGALYLLATLLFMPYLRGYQLFYTGFDPSPASTAPGQLFTIHGLALFLLSSAMVLELYVLFQSRRRPPLWLAGSRSVAYGLAIPAPLTLMPSSAFGAASLTLFSLAAGLYLVGERSAALVVACGAPVPLLAVRRRFSGGGLLLLAAVGLGLLAILLPELVALKGDVGRMNTVFKFHLQAWVLLSVGAAVGLSFLLRRGRLLPPEFAIWREGWAVIVIVLLFAAATYPLLATPVKTALRFVDAPALGTLDGMDYMERATFSDRERDLMLPADYRALLWIQDNIAGTPVIAEGHAGLYRWGSRVSIYTGLPTIIGWDWHQKQQRWGYQSMIDERLRDVKTLFESDSMERAWPVIDRYRVRYVYVGGLERAYYPASGLDKFESAPGSDLARVYQQGGVTIYRVDRIPPG